MSTNAAIGKIVNGQFAGRYVHWDGDPASLGRSLLTLVRRDGVFTVLRTIYEEHYGWSSINPGLSKRPSDEVLDANPSNHKLWEDLRSGSRSDGRFEGVSGYGIAYTLEDEGTDQYDFVTFAVDEPTIAYAYALDVFSMTILKYGEGEVGRVAYKDFVPLDYLQSIS